jgi:outer membrane protein TolC
MRQAAADAVTIALDTVMAVQERYAAIQAAEQLVPLLQERLSLLGKLTSVANDRLNAGEGVRSDVTTLEAQRVELQVDIADARIQLREDRLRLARLIAEPSGAAAWTIVPWWPPSAPAGAEEQWVEAALHHRPEVQSIAWRLAALGDDEALATLLPWEGASLGADVQRDDKWFAGPSVSTPLPLFDSGQTAKARVTAEQIEARHDLILAKRKVIEDVRVAYQSLAASAANLQRIKGELLPLQQQRRQQAEDAFRSGHADITGLYLAEQDLRATQAKAIDVAQRAMLAQLRLQRAVGGQSVADTVDATVPVTDISTPTRIPVSTTQHTPRNTP